VADPEAIALAPEHLARRHHILPLAVDADDRTLTVAVPDLFNLVALDQLRAHLEGRYDIQPVLAAEAQILEHLDKFYGFDLSVDGILKEIETGEVDWSSRLGAKWAPNTPSPSCAWSMPCWPKRSSAAHRTSTSSRKPRSCACATASTACWNPCAACTGNTGRPSRCA
jgi:hypothetical protein